MDEHFTNFQWKFYRYRLVIKFGPNIECTAIGINMFVWVLENIALCVWVVPSFSVYIINVHIQTTHDFGAMYIVDQ